jgi:sulfotransferase
MQQVLSARSEFHAHVNDVKRQAVLRGLVFNYFADVEPGKVVFDTNRTWCSKINLLMQLFPAAKVVCCVRPLSWIFDSFERIVRRNPLEPSRLFNYEAAGTVYGRVETLNHPITGPVGSSYKGLKEAFYGEHASDLLLVNYESLAREPEKVMLAIYEFLGERPCTHDYDNVKFDALEFDQRLGVPGLHQVNGKVEFIERETILPPDIFSRFDNTSFWCSAQCNLRKVWVV